jgi:OOP family OmpA-OmpF porin
MKRFAVLALALLTPVAAAAGFDARVCGIDAREEQAGLDDDRDGVPDSDDWCRDTPAGTRVGASGCGDAEVPVRCDPRPAPKPAPPPPPPASAEPAIDSDADGVLDPSDRCTDTPAALSVDAKGCVLVERVVLRGDSFVLGSNMPGEIAALRAIADTLKANPRMAIEVGGHTDSVGDIGGNQRLSRRRADAVRQFLVGQGIDPKRLSATGYGEARPVDTNQTDAGRANNRRVEFRIIRE